MFLKNYIRLYVVQRNFIFFVDAGSLTWNEPLPFQIVPDSDVVEHLNSTKLIEGTINATLSWQFSLLEFTFESLTITFDGTAIAGVRSSRQGVNPGFKDKYELNWILGSQRVTLVIFQVTTAENGTFTCEVSAQAVGAFTTTQWRSNIQVDVVGKLDKLKKIPVQPSQNVFEEQVIRKMEMVLVPFKISFFLSGPLNFLFVFGHQ